LSARRQRRGLASAEASVAQLLALAFDPVPALGLLVQADSADPPQAPE
jgi:hypothetical protein